MAEKGHAKDTNALKTSDSRAHIDTFVLDKGIFSNIFEKDIRRVYIYKKAERLAKAIHLISPAFRNAPELRNRMDRIAIGLVDAAILPPSSARGALSRELLALSSVLSIARTGGLLSSMNVEVIAREAHQLLQEIAGYEEPRLFLDDTPSLASLAKELTVEHAAPASRSGSEAAGTTRIRSGTPASTPRSTATDSIGHDKGHISDKKNERKDAIIAVLKEKGTSYIKDISVTIRSVSEKTIQRELQVLVDEGIVKKEGARRWTTYTLIS